MKMQKKDCFIKNCKKFLSYIHRYSQYFIAESIYLRGLKNYLFLLYKKNIFSSLNFIGINYDNDLILTVKNSILINSFRNIESFEYSYKL